MLIKITVRAVMFYLTLFRIEKIITKTIKIAFIYKMKVAKKQLEKEIYGSFKIELFLSISTQF
jgi:hypothetical protein